MSAAISGSSAPIAYSSACASVICGVGSCAAVTKESPTFLESHPVLECPAKFLHAEPDARFYRPEWFAEVERDFLLCVAAEIGHLQSQPLLRWEPGQCRA